MITAMERAAARERDTARRYLRTLVNHKRAELGLPVVFVRGLPVTDVEVVVALDDAGVAMRNVRTSAARATEALNKALS